jgi:hypothetical protein
MRSNKLQSVILLCGLLLGFLVLCDRTVPGQAPATKPSVKWEYMSLLDDNVDDKMVRDLDEFGQQGWELVTITRPGSPNQHQLSCVLKRVKP